MAAVLILGAGHAGGTLAALLRMFGHEGAITLVGDEPVAPYQRPPLSKAWLKGDADAASLALKPAAFYPENAIDFRPSLRAERIGRTNRKVSFDNGSSIDYDILVIATGARAIVPPIPGVTLKGVLVLRSAADAERLKAALGPGRRLTIVGGGYIGLEAAATARLLGAEAVVIEREERLLARVAGPALSEFFQAQHEGQGVRFALGASVTGFVGEEGHVRAVELADGSSIACDAVLVGVGAAPNDELARDARIACERGVVVDIEGRTSDDAIFAIGDVAHRPLPLYARMSRLESVPNALEQAKQVASAITGRPPPAGEVPWFWSDQYALKLQIAGLPFDADRIVMRGDPAVAKFALFHLCGDRIQAVEAVNAPQEFLIGRQLILGRKPIDVERLADPSVSMKEVAAQ